MSKEMKDASLTIDLVSNGFAIRVARSMDSYAPVLTHCAVFETKASMLMWLDENYSDVAERQP